MNAGTAALLGIPNVSGAYLPTGLPLAVGTPSLNVIAMAREGLDRYAGIDILARQKKPIGVAIKYMLLAILIFIAFLLIMVMSLYNGLYYLSDIILPISLVVTIVMFLIWFWAAFRIKNIKV